MTTTRTAPATHRTLTGLAAALALVVLVFGVPVALSVVAPIDLPDSWPVWTEIWHIVMRPDDGRLALAVIRLIAWGSWGAFTWSVAIETHAALRNTTAREIHALGFFQRAAATLVAAVLLSLASPINNPPAAAPAPDAVAAQVLPDATASESRSLTPAAPTPRAHGSVARAWRTDPQLPVITVEDGDSLWFLAERHLGAGARYTEILDLNLGRSQPDGRSLTDAHWIEPGWQLLLPADAVDVTPSSDTVTAPASPGGTVVVAPGDSLWKLAQAHLGDGDRYPEIFELNAGVLQPDGRALTEPRLIRPGWVLALPPSTGEDQPDAPPPTSATTVDAGTGSTSAPAAPPSEADAPIPDADPVADPPAAIAPDAAERVPEAEIALPDSTEATPAAVPDAVAVASDPASKSDSQLDATDPGASSSSAALVLGLTALTAAGLIGELARRRLLQRRVRRTGERISMPGPGSPADDAERLWRATPTPLSLGQIRTALDNLASSCFAGERDLPRVGTIEVGPDKVTVRLVEDEDGPVSPFTAEGPRTWTAATAALARLGPVDRSRVPEPYPALVAVGHSASSTVLINLEAAGTIRVVGDADAAGGVLRALVAELATSELTGRIGLTAGDEFADLAAACAPSRLQAPPAPGSAVQLADRLAGVGRSLHRDGLDDTLQARSDRTSPDLWLPVVFVDDVPDAAPCAPWCGSVLITNREGPGGWTLTVGPDGDASLDALTVRLTAARLEPSGLRLVTELLTAASPPALDQPLPPGLVATDQGARAALATLPALRPQVRDPGGLDGVPGMRINVLGLIQIENVPTGQRLTPRQTELLVYLALRGDTTGPAMDEDLWPGSRTDGVARWGLAYRTRRIVMDANLPRTEKGDTLHLGPGVSCDWDDFRRHAAAGLAAGAEGLSDLKAALDLVRGRPLTGVPPSAYSWADRDTDAMISAIADVAHTLAHLLLDSGDSRAALDAALTGLASDPCSEDLRDTAVAAAFAHGDAEEARRIQDRHAALLAELDDEYV